MPSNCFMVMPYSTKPTGAPAGSGAPDKINFDRLWEAALRPAIQNAGYEAVRANEDIGAPCELFPVLASNDNGDATEPTQ
jgi:hypothetical protein